MTNWTVSRSWPVSSGASSLSRAVFFGAPCVIDYIDDTVTELPVKSADRIGPGSRDLAYDRGRRSDGIGGKAFAWPGRANPGRRPPRRRVDRDRQSCAREP